MGASSESDVAARGLSLRVRRNRAGFEALRRVADFCAGQFRAHLATEFRELPLDERGRAFVRWLVSGFPLPDDARFWELLAYAEAHVGPADQWLLNAIEIEEVVVPPGWRDAARCVLRVCAMLRTNARFTTEHWSERYRKIWEKGDAKALVEMVRDDGVNETWVGSAISRLRAQQLSGTSEERTSADDILRRIGSALSYVGTGQRGGRSSSDQQRAQSEAQRVSKAIRRLVGRYQKEMQFFPPEKADRVYEQIAEMFQTTTSIPEPARGKIVEGFKGRCRSGLTGGPPGHRDPSTERP